MLEFENGASMSMDNDLNTLWQELDLKGLLNTHQSAITHQNYTGTSSSSSGMIKKKRKPPTALEKVYEKPSFKMIMDRYKSAPKRSGHAPTNRRIDNLADPIRGRYKGIEKAKDSGEYIVSPTKEDIEVQNRQHRIKKNNKSTSFFLTGEDEMDQEDDDEEDFELNPTPLRDRSKRPSNLMDSKTAKRGVSSDLIHKIRNSAKTFEENEKKRMLRLSKNTKANRSLFVDKYLSTKDAKKGRTTGARGKSSGYGQTFKSSSKKSALASSAKSKTNTKKKPDWSLRPPLSKADAKLLNPLPSLTTKKRVINDKNASLTRNISKNMKKKEPLRSKSSADMRRNAMKENKNPDSLGRSELRKKPSSSASSLVRENTRLQAKVFGESNGSDKLSRLHRGLSSKPATVLSPIKPLPPRPKTPVDKVNEVYKDLKKRVGLTNAKKPANTNTLGNVEVKESIDMDVKTALSRAEDLSHKNTRSVDNATIIFGQKAKNISSRLDAVTNMKASYQLELE